MLPVVVYDGSEPWTATGQESDLTPLPSKQARADLALLQPQAYRLLAAGGTLTSGAGPAKDWPWDNWVSAAVRLQAAAMPQDLLPRLLEESARFPGPGNEAFRRALWEYKTGSGVGFPTFEELERTKGAIMTTVAEAAWDRREAKVRAEGIEQGVERGVRLERMNEAAQRCAEIVGPGLSSLDHGDILHDERGLPKSSSHS